ncbi:hypothetical protein JD844_028377 [Phrynosoma platyrhinos]|uniref:CARD domain-containing protein n=1 Tax=Phrynosoma platyrhinos TaxID=52577 RepID=A0ABQ7SI14_PHRPL|nr:hypothetical protein JD844_028377 [Phrynosoma platyrhinos]
MTGSEDTVDQIQSVLEGEEEEDVLWEKIESVRHQLTRSLNPAKLTPYLRQCRVIDEQDEEESAENSSTQLVGNSLPDEEGPEGLTQFLMMEVKKARAQRKGHLAKEHQLQVKNRTLEEECSKLKQQLRELQKMQERWQRFQEEWDSSSLELLRLKDENYMLAMRYAQLCDEKNAAVLRSRDLQLGVDQLKCKVSSMEEECSLLRKQVLMAPHRETEDCGLADTISDLRAENQRLVASLQELQNVVQTAGEGHVSGSDRILLDILEHDWKEAQADRQELCQKLDSVQNELQWAEGLRAKYLQDMEDLQLKYQTLQKNCDLYKHRMNTVLAQLEEIEKERDQAIQSRDGVQLQYSQSLIEKDQYRKRVRALEEERDELLSKLTQAEGKIGTLEAQLQRCQCTRSLAKKMCSSSYSLCSILSSTWSMIEKPSAVEDGMGDVPGILNIAFPGDCTSQEEVTGSSQSYGSFGSMEDLTGSITTTVSSARSPSSSGSAHTRTKSEICLSTVSNQQEFARRSVLVHLSSTHPLTIPTPQSRGLAGDISILGGNRTGIYVQWVRPGSEAESVGLREGCRLLEIRGTQLNGEVLSLENCTREVAYLSLLHWDDPSSLLFLPDRRGYQPLKEALDAGQKVPGDSFYVRANLNLLELADPYALCVKCREILHITDTLHKGRLEWYCARVDPFTLRDLDKGTVPNYSRAQQLLKIQAAARQKGGRTKLKKRALNQLHLVKRKQQEGQNENLWPDPCLDVLEEQSLSSASFKNSVNVDRISQSQKNSRRIHAIQEAIGKNKHCLLDLEVQVVRDLIKSEIHPIVIHIEVTEKNIRGVRSLLGKPGRRDSELLKECRRAEVVLYTLPCSWAWVDPQAWGSAEELVKVVRAQVFQEQTRIVWAEENDM